MKPILIITYWSFNDALVQTYTLPYVKLIHKITGKKMYLVCLEQQKIGTTTAQRHEINKMLSKEGIEVIFFDYNRFGIKQILTLASNLFFLIYIILSKRIAFIHSWCTPGGAIGYILSVITGRTLILDSYEPHADLMVETGTWGKEGMAFKILSKLEKLQTKRASKIIGVVPEMRDFAKLNYDYTIPEENFFVKPACVDFDVFFPREKNNNLLKSLKLQNKIIGIYAGKIGGIYLEDALFDFIKQCHEYWEDKFVMLLLTGSDSLVIKKQLERVGVPEQVVRREFVAHSEIANYMALGDFAVNFMKPVPTRKLSAPIKDGEYWALGLPVIITSGIAGDSQLIEDYDIGYVLKDLTNSEYLNGIKKIESLLTHKIATNDKIWSLVKKKRNFSVAQDIYEKIYR